MRTERTALLTGVALLLPTAALAADSASGGGMLDLNLTLLIQAANYVVFVLLMNAVLFRPVIEHLDARRRKVEEAEVKTELAEKEARRVERKRCSALDAAMVEATRERQKVKSAAVDHYQQVVQEARAEADARVQEAQDRYQVEAEEVAAELEENVGELAALVKAKLLDEGGTPDAGKEASS